MAARGGCGRGDENANGADAAAAALREQVVHRLLASDMLNSVKAHMRVRLYAELKRAAGPGAAPAAKAPPSLQRHVLDCLVAEFLLAAQHKYSLSVFLAETGSGALPQLARADILRLIGVLPESRVHALLTAGSPDSGGSSATAAPCLAESMVAALGTLGGRVSTHTTAAQTDSDGSGDGSGAPSSCQLAQRLQQVEEEYRRRSGQLEAASAEALETRMAAYRRECEARCEAQLQERLAAARGAEAAAAAEQEAGRHRRELEAERDALQAAHRERLAQLQAAEEALHERSRRHQREQDALREEHLRRLRADEERLAAWKADSEAKLAAREAAARQQLAQAEAAAQQASAQQAAAKQRLAAMLAEVQAREAAAGRAQAAADAQGSRVPQLQAQLAAALEEQGSLRQQLAAARAAQQAEAAERQRQVEALQAEQARLAAAAEGPRLSPAEAQRMQHAVRRLLQRTDDLQAEAEACRGREALWKGAATKAERLLGKAAKLQDRTLQQAEELRLALAAAAREVADLQQQAALAAAGAEGPQAAALQAASRDAQRWREGVEARVDAARQQEEGLRREAAQLQQRALASRTCMAQGLQQLLAARMQSRRQSDAAEHEQGCCPPEVPPAAPWEAAGTESAGLTRKAVGLPSVAERPGAWAPQPAQQQQPHPPLSARPPMQLQQLPPAVPAAVLQYANPLAIPYSSDASTPHDTSPRAQAGAAAPPGPPAVPSRTASDILAAYRARQQLRSSGGGAAQAVVSARRSGAGSSQDEAPAGGGAEAEDEAEADAAGASQQQQAPGDAAAGVQDQDSGAAVGGMGAAAATVAEPSTFTVDDDFPSDDSSRF